MRVSFSDRRLERCFADEDEAVRRWGAVVGRRYIMRVRLLQEARSLDELLAVRALRLHALKGDREGQWSLVLHGRWRLIIERGPAEDIVVKEVTNHYGD